MSVLGTIFQWLGYAQYNSSPPVATSGQNVPLQCDVNGNLLINLSEWAIGIAFLPVTGSATLTTAQVASQGLILTGSPSGAFTLTFPTTTGVPLVWLIQNDTAQTATISASTGGTSQTLPGATLGWFLFDGTNFSSLVPGGGGGSGGPTLLATIYTTPGSPLTRAAAWMRQPVDTLAGACGFTAPSTAVVGDQLDALDAGRSWGTTGKQFTFHGGSFLVEDPFNQSAALASSWTGPVGFSDVAVSWTLINDTTLGTYWKAL